MKIKKKIIIAFCIACSAVFCSCGNQAEALLKYVDKNDFSGAVEYYKDKIKGNKSDDFKDEFEEGLEDRYDDIIDAFENNDIESLEDFFELLNVTKIRDGEFEESLSSRLDEYNDRAAKIAEQTIIKIVELETVGPIVSDGVISIDADGNAEGIKEAEEIVSELKSMMRDAFPCEAYIKIDNGMITSVLYRVPDSGLAGAYPGKISSDDLKNGYTFDDLKEMLIG